MRLTNVQQQYVQILKIHLNRKINVQIVGRNSFNPIRNVALSVLIFMKFTVA